MATTRVEAKAKRRQELLAAAASIMAQKGFHHTRLADVGAAAGISGPGLYRHFDSKEALLAEILLDVSEDLVEQAQGVIQAVEKDPEAGSESTLRELVNLHVDVSVDRADETRLQMREIDNVEESVRNRVRALQGAYLRLWSEAMMKARPALEQDTARLRVQLVVGMLNTNRYVLHRVEHDHLKKEAREMALAALLKD